MTAAQHLTELETSGLIRLAATQPEIEYLFRHALVQDAAYASILKADRRRLHQWVGEVVEKAYADRLDELAPVLARHFDEAGDEVRALQYYTRAADGAAATYANVEAEMHYARALALAERGAAPGVDFIHLFTARGRVLELSARYDAALANYQAAVQTARARGDHPLELAGVMAQASIHAAPTARYDPVQAKRLAAEASALAAKLGDGAAESKVLWQLMLITRFTGEWRESVRYGEQALALARQLNLRQQLAFILNDLVFIYPGLGRADEAWQILAEARALWTELDNQPMLADAWCNTSGLAVMFARPEEGFAAAAEARRISESIGNLWGQSYSRYYTPLVHIERGEYAEAIQGMEECIALGQQAGFLVPQVDTRSYLSFAYGLAGDFDYAVALAKQAAASAEQVLPLFRANPLAALVWLCAERGEVEAAAAAHAEVYRLADLEDPGAYEARLVLGLAEGALGLARRDYAGVVRRIDAALATSAHTGLRIFLSWYQYYKGQALLGLGQVAEAAAVLAQARAEAERLTARTALWRILMAQAEIAALRSQAAEAASLRTNARALVQYIADHCPPHLRASFLAVPDVRAVLNLAAA